MSATNITTILIKNRATRCLKEQYNTAAYYVVGVNSNSHSEGFGLNGATIKTRWSYFVKYAVLFLFLLSSVLG